MKTAKTLIVAALVALGLAAVAAPAAAAGYGGGAHYGGARYGGGYYGGARYGGGHYGGGYYGRGWYGGPSVNFSLGYWGPWGGYWGPGYWGGPGYGYGYYGAPVVVVPSEPRVYVERDEPYSSAPSASGHQQWWYWCASANGYYPYVSACSEGWQRVPPQPMQAPR